MTLAILGCFYLNAAAKKTPAQTPKKSTEAPDKIAQKSFRKKAIVKDTVVMNFKVCKSDNGYAICGEAPGNSNSTYEEPQKPVKHPVYEEAKSDVIVLKSVPLPPKIKYPMDKPGPETQSGAWIGVCSWNGIW